MPPKQQQKKGGKRGGGGGGGGGGAKQPQSAKEGGGGGSKPQDAKDEKLNWTARPFVPQSNLKANAPAWTPGASGAQAVVKSAGAAAAPAPASAASPTASAAAPAPTLAASAWGKKPLDAVKAAPSATAPSQHQRQPSGGRIGGGQRSPQKGVGADGGSWRTAKQGKGKGKGGRGNQKGGHGSQPTQQQQQQEGGADGGWQRGKSLPVELLKAGEGKDDATRAVQRYSAEDLLALRLSFLAPPLSWSDEEQGPPDHCRWDSPTRVVEIDAAHKTPRMGGDATAKRRKQPADTAPPLEECKPLEVNEETRWKAKVFVDKGKEGEEENEPEESDDEVIKKALLILNKLSLTKFDKLSDAFIDCGIGRNETCLHDAIGLIVKKAQDEPHFSAMYAALCLKLARTPLDLENGSAKKGKKFKKMLLERCQEEFESDTATKIAHAIEGVEDEEERQLKAGLVKKHYLGHMRFIGELYKGDLLSIKIILFCLPALLEGETNASAPEEKKEEKDSNEIDEEKVECFSKLMATIGSSLEKQCDAMRSVGKVDAAEKLSECWDTVEVMAGLKKKANGPVVSNRIKFMLQDLIEMRNKGWVTRRQEETAKTIAQIHKEVANEEARASRRSQSSTPIRRLASSGDVRSLGQQQERRQSKPQVDADGFVEVKKSASGFQRSASMGSFRSSSDGWKQQGGSGRNPKGSVVGGGMKRVSSGGSFAAFNDKMERRSPKKDEKKPPKEDVSDRTEEAKTGATEATAVVSKKEYMSPDECADKAKNILKEYFVGGDTDDAVLSFHELVGAGDEGSVDRGAKVVEGGVLLVLEMKKENVDMFLTVALKCFKENKLGAESVIAGLNDPLEFLSDIEIDAPLAGDHLATIVSEFIKADAMKLDFLLGAPEYFRSDGRPAHFAVKVLKKLGGDDIESEVNLGVVEKLMTSEDKETHSSAKDMLSS